MQFGIEKMGVKISNVIVHADDTSVTRVWNMTMRVDDKDVDKPPTRLRRASVFRGDERWRP